MMRSRLAARWPAAVGVAVVHLFVLALALGRRESVQPEVSLPISALILEAAAEPREEVPLPLPTLVVPAVIVEMPSASIAIQEEPARTPTSTADAEHVAAAAATAASESIVEARFDADYLNNPQPIYPPISRRLREQGIVVLKVRVSVAGAGESVLLHRSSGSRRLDEAALMAVRRWRFVPARLSGAAVESWVLVPVEFKLQV